MKNILLFTFMFLVTNYGQTTELPDGWVASGSNPAGYNIYTVMDEGQHPPVAVIKSNDHANKSQFGTLVQRFSPEEYIGKRLKMNVWIKSKNVTGWAGAWLRIDDVHANSVAFDNMENRSVIGTVDWHQYSIVVDVPEDSASINYGVLLAGEGQVWIDEFSFEVVTTSEPTTDMFVTKVLNKKPKNNGF